MFSQDNDCNYVDDDDDDDVLMFATAAAAYENGDDAGGLYCGRVFDNVTCWPDTKAGHIAAVPCPTHFRGLQLTSGQCEIINSTYFLSVGQVVAILTHPQIVYVHVFSPVAPLP